jgi:hypothetical protein
MKIDIQELIDYLQGGCKTLNEGVSDISEGVLNESNLTIQQHEIIDSEIFRCESCGWWHEISEQSEDGENCIECL